MAIDFMKSEQQLEREGSSRSAPCYAHWVSAEAEGSCNFCTERKSETVWKVSSRDPMRGMSVLFCPNCKDAIFKA